MPFGGVSPMPLRLGAPSDTSISPEQWLRLCDDVVQQKHPLAVLIISEPSATSGACTVSGLHMGGTDPGATITATLTELSPGFAYRIDIDMGNGYIDTTTGDEVRWSATLAQGRAVGVVASASIAYSGNVISYTYSNSRATPLSHTLVVFGATEQRWAGDYGAEPSKRSAGAAAETPYAWTWLQEMQLVRGDAFSTDSASFTQRENLVLARMFGYLQSIAERHAAGQIPMQADQVIGRWATWMNVGTTDDRDWQVRRKCAAKYALTTTGASQESLDAAAELLFGSNFYGISWTPGTIDGPPANTYWPGGDAGPGALNLGDGPWTSSRYHMTVELTAANQAEATRLLNLAHRDFDEMLQSSMPPVVTWAYRFNPTNGFILDTSRLDQESL